MLLLVPARKGQQLKRSPITKKQDYETEQLVQTHGINHVLSACWSSAAWAQSSLRAVTISLCHWNLGS